MTDDEGGDKQILLFRTKTELRMGNNYKIVDKEDQGIILTQSS